VRTLIEQQLACNNRNTTKIENDANDEKGQVGCKAWPATISVISVTSDSNSRDSWFVLK
jgi:hypothetical protein